MKLNSCIAKFGYRHSVSSVCHQSVTGVYCDKTTEVLGLAVSQKNSNMSQQIV